MSGRGGGRKYFVVVVVVVVRVLYLSVDEEWWSWAESLI